MTDSNCITHATTTPRVILSGAAPPVQGRTRKPIIAAKSNPEGAPAGGISALVYDIPTKHIPLTERAR